MDKDFKMPFGRHEGETLEEIDKYDPGYLRWLANQNGNPSAALARVRGFLNKKENDMEKTEPEINFVAPPNIYKLIPKIMAEIGAIGKNRTAGTGGGASYAFRGIDDIYNAMHGPLSDNGVFFTTEVLSEERSERPSKQGGVLGFCRIKAKFTFFAGDGSSISSITIGEGMDSSDKASNKAMSAAVKYALIQLFCVPTVEEKDSENESPQIGYASDVSKGTKKNTPPPPPAKKGDNKREIAERATIARDLFKTIGVTDTATKEEWFLKHFKKRGGMLSIAEWDRALNLLDTEVSQKTKGA